MALVNKIIPFSCIDGPGNRTSIFFQGCNFKCSYCHNPETINKCVNCGKCVAVCPVNALEIKDNEIIFSWSCPNRVNGEYSFGFEINYASLS